MLQWATDSGEAEHRAYWGANRIEQGNAGTPARHFMGPIPRDWLGQWKRVEVPAEVTELADARQRARETGDYGEADRLRERLRELGWEVRDSAQGPELRPLQ